MAYRNIDSVSKKIRQGKEGAVSNMLSGVKPSKKGGGLKSLTLKPRFKKSFYRKLTSSFLIFAMLFQIIGGVFYVPTGEALADISAPNQISGLVFWVKADAGVTQSGDRVSAWADQSSSGNNMAQATVANQPTYISNGVNGLPVVRITGSPVTIWANSEVTSRTVFVVYKDNGTTDDYGDILGGHNQSHFSGSIVSSGKLIDGTYASLRVRDGQGYVDGVTIAPTSIAVSTSFHIYSFVTTADVKFQNLGQNQDQANRFRKGDYAEVIAYSGVLNNTDRHSVESYLGSKYGITVSAGLPRITVYADGDSVTANPNNYTGYYQTDIQNNVENVSLVDVVNVAVSGRDEATMLSNLQGNVLSHSPDILTLSTSLNDIWLYNGGIPGGSSGFTQLTTNIVSYINRVMATRNPLTGLPPQLILMTDNFSGQRLDAYPRPWQDQYNTAHAVLDAYNQFSNNPNVHVVDNFTPFYNLGVDTSALYDKLLPDQVHPNVAGYVMIHNNIRPSLISAADRIISGTVADSSTSTAYPSSGVYSSTQYVSLIMPAYSAFTYYTLDGSDPDNTKTPYAGGTIALSGPMGSTVTLKTVSYDSNGNTGPVFTGDYKFATPIDDIDFILGTARVGFILTAGSISPTNATVSYQWTRSDTVSGIYTDIPGAISSTYTPIASDSNKHIKVVVTGYGSFSGSLISAPTSQIEGERASFISPAKPSTSAINITTSDNTLSLTNIPATITQIAVSASPDFANSSWEDISKEEDLLKQYSNQEEIYIKLRTNDGAVSDIITYNPQQATNNNSQDNTTTNDGDIVKTPNSPDIYVIKTINNKKYKRLILSPNVFNSYNHLRWDNVKTITEEQLSQYTTSNLVKESLDNIIYAFTAHEDQGTRQPFDITQTYDPDSIYTINKTERDSYEWEE